MQFSITACDTDNHDQQDATKGDAGLRQGGLILGLGFCCHRIIEEINLLFGHALVRISIDSFLDYVLIREDRWCAVGVPKQ